MVCGIPPDLQNNQKGSNPDNPIYKITKKVWGLELQLLPMPYSCLNISTVATVGAYSDIYITLHIYFYITLQKPFRKKSKKRLIL